MSTVLACLIFCVYCIMAQSTYITLDVYSRGFDHDIYCGGSPYSYITINNGSNLITPTLSGGGCSKYRGLNLVILNETNGELIYFKTYDTSPSFQNYSSEDITLRNYLNTTLSNTQHIIILCVDDDAGGSDDTFNFIKYEWNGCPNIYDHDGPDRRRPFIWIGKAGRNNEIWCETSVDQYNISKHVQIELEYVEADKSEHNEDANGSDVLLIIGISLGILGIVSVVIAIYIVRRKKKKGTLQSIDSVSIQGQIQMHEEVNKNKDSGKVIEEGQSPEVDDKEGYDSEGLYEQGKDEHDRLTPKTRAAETAYIGDV